jgi:hypothetical protein
VGAPELLIVAFVLCLLVLPIVVVVWVAKASSRYQRNVRLTALLTGSRELEPVGVGLRLLAFIIDLVVLGIAVGSITAAVDAATSRSSPLRPKRQRRPRPSCHDSPGTLSACRFGLTLSITWGSPPEARRRAGGGSKCCSLLKEG